MDTQYKCSLVRWNELGKQLVKHDVSILSVNAHSIKKPGKFAEFLSYLDTSGVNFAFIVVVETWLKYELSPLFEIEGYSSKSVCRSNRNGGGIKLFYRNEISGEVIDEFSGVLDSCESLIFRANMPIFGNIIVCCVYRPPDQSADEFCNFSARLLDYCGDSPALVIRDFNLNIMKYIESSQVNSYVEFSTSFGHNNGLDCPTYIS